MTTAGLRFTSASGAAAIAAVCVFLVVSRAGLAPKYLYYFDSVNFALAIQDFNPALHQPQPPGYPLFVATTKLIHWMLGSVHQTFVVTGILVSAAAIIAVWLLTRDLFGRRAAHFAGLLLLFHPSFWLAGLTNQVRLFLALGAAVVMIAAWRSLAESGSTWFWAAFALLGALSGFRPEILLFSLPVLIYVGVSRRRSLREWLAALLLIGMTVGGWLWVAIHASGGIQVYVQLILDYISTQFGSTSAPFGAEGHAALRMLRMALIWYGFPVLSWVCMVPFAPGVGPHLRDAARFLAIACLPSVVFHAVIHVGDPDHTLFGAAVLCAIGGLVLARLKQKALVITALGVSSSLFFLPLNGIARAFTYAAVRGIDRLTRETFETIQDLKLSGPVVIVAYDHRITWRNLSYYFPELDIIVLHDPPISSDAGNPSAWLIRRQNIRVLQGTITLGPNQKIVWLLSRGRGMHRLLSNSSLPLQTYRNLAYLDVRGSTAFRFGRYAFASTAFEQLR